MNQQLPMEYPNRMAREDRLIQLAEICARANMPLTVRQVARLAGLAKTYHVTTMLDELAELGVLERVQVEGQYALPTNLYLIRPEHLAKGAE